MSALPQPPAAQPGPQILIVRPLWAMVVVCWGIMVAVDGPLLWMGASILLQGNLSGLIIATSGLLFAGWIYNSVAGAYLWVDAESVGLHRPWRSANCLKSDLDYLLVDNPGIKRGRPRCSFVRKDGRVAFRIPATPYGRAQLASLADYLEVPLTGLESDW
ncbi:MAG TPA: hypothetical protein VG104_01775 [Candidatus Dormibacteraeota bacterium]|jgi:hypothetical protein|nr:hypothetical protein [Candidatus Dormibacteraeota bacterium]